MRCPKCQYISFESGGRCRNCGYELSLSAGEPPLDVTIARDEPGPGRIRDVAHTALDRSAAGRAEDDLALTDEEFSSAHRLPSAADLPLFTERVADDQAPLVTPPAVPRPPLSVRRTSPMARARGRPAPADELPLGLGPERDAGGPDAGAASRVVTPAGLVRRTTAGLIDATILGAIAWAVVYLTLRAAGVPPEQWRALPLAPLASFLLLLAGGYFILFTAAGGQTIGKMTTGIRVVTLTPDGTAARVSFATALVRALACFGSVAAIGAGFVPAVVSPERRAFHDRVADTRVVPA